MKLLTYVHTYTCTRAYTCIYMHTHIHTYIHTYIHTSMSLALEWGQNEHLTQSGPNLVRIGIETVDGCVAHDGETGPTTHHTLLIAARKGVAM